MDDRIKHEIEHGKFLAGSGAGEIWNWESAAGKLRWARRVGMLTEFIRPATTLLELGCGTGYFTKEIATTGAHVTAIDISPELLVIAKNNVPHPNVSFLQENAYRMTLPNNHFDYVVGSSVLHHLDIRKAVAEIYRILKDGGIIAFTEPNMMNPQIALQKNIPWLKRRLGDSPDETAFFRWKISRLLRKQGFKKVETRPFDFLHPAVPPACIKAVTSAGNLLEKCPILKEIAGSIFIKAYK
ncbi:MAG: class I SAM-dependent methyltransferase [Dysgonamonadaceae bacterium]|jgi:ubiquinone/menaquinone biosynthesis C-methylase UbiE|nr:class I SAM-dependent methyltransferase [Dysgonamonadaceae bacterium]